MTRTPPIDIYTPSNIQLGGRTASTSMLTTWLSCPYRWYLSYLAPHPTKEPTRTAGLRNRYSSPALSIGSAVHSSLQAYRASGWSNGQDTGDYQLDVALEALSTSFRESAHRWRDQSEIIDNAANAARLIQGYHYDRDHANDFRVVGDEHGDPYIEREFHIELAGYTYTVKVDAIGKRYNRTAVEEYKTTGVYTLTKTLNTIHMNLQTKAEWTVLVDNFPDVDFDGIDYWFFIKDRHKYKTSKWPSDFYQHPVTPLMEDAEQFKNNATIWLRQMDASIEIYEDAIAADMKSPYANARDIFPQSGMGANEYGTPLCNSCDFRDHCESANLGNDEATLNEYIPHTLDGVQYEIPEDEREEYSEVPDEEFAGLDFA